MASTKRSALKWFQPYERGQQGLSRVWWQIEAWAEEGTQAGSQGDGNQKAQSVSIKSTHMGALHLRLVSCHSLNALNCISVILWPNKYHSLAPVSHSMAGPSNLWV